MEFSLNGYSATSNNTKITNSLDSPLQNLFVSFLKFFTNISIEKNQYSVYSLQFLSKLIDLEIKNFSNRFGTMNDFGSVILDLINRIPNSSEQQMLYLIKIFIKYLMISLQVPLGFVLIYYLIVRFGKFFIFGYFRIYF